MQSITAVSKPTRIRFQVLSFLFINVVINYMDRSNISVAASAISKDLKLSSVQLGYIFSAFGWTYALMQIPGGLLVDRFGPRLVYTFSLVAWSLVTLFQGFVKGFASLFGLRLATGLFESPAYPANNHVVTSWFPANERASAIAVYTSGQFIGLAFLTPALAGLQHYIGWRGMVIATGSVGIIWGMIWYLLYRDPLVHAKINKTELDLIEKGGGIISQKATLKKESNQRLTKKDFKEVFMSRKLWGIYIGQFAINATLWFFLTWFPTYLVTYRGFSFIKSGFLTSAPFMAAFAGLLLSGFQRGHLRRWSAARHA